MSVSKDVMCWRMLRSRMMRVRNFFVDEVIFRGCYVSEDVMCPRMLCVRGCFVYEDVMSLRMFCFQGYYVSEDVRWPRVLSSVVNPDLVESET
jgi:hypothetical protein